MSSSQKESASGGQPPVDYGYGHGGYGGYGYGYGDEEGTAHRSLQDYLLILRERIWYIIVVFLVVGGLMMLAVREERSPVPD